MHHPTDRITHTTAFDTPVVEHWLEREIAQWVHPMKDRSDDPSHNERTLYPHNNKTESYAYRQTRLLCHESKTSNKVPPLPNSCVHDPLWPQNHGSFDVWYLSPCKHVQMCQLIFMQTSFAKYETN